MELEEMLVLEAKCYVAMSEIDYDLIQWHRRHYSPSKEIHRSMLHATWDMSQAFRKMRKVVESAKISVEPITK